MGSVSKSGSSCPTRFLIWRLWKVTRRETGFCLEFGKRCRLFIDIKKWIQDWNYKKNPHTLTSEKLKQMNFCCFCFKNKNWHRLKFCQFIVSAPTGTFHGQQTTNGCNLKYYPFDPLPFLVDESINSLFNKMLKHFQKSFH